MDGNFLNTTLRKKLVPNKKQNKNMLYVSIPEAQDMCLFF